ncbi:hypothetical protein BZG21_31975, partial [Escherichia coli]|nr:hypothetical protein [Escherichia coli]
GLYHGYAVKLLSWPICWRRAGYSEGIVPFCCNQNRLKAELQRNQRTIEDFNGIIEKYGVLCGLLHNLQFSLVNGNGECLMEAVQLPLFLALYVQMPRK